MVSSAFYEGHNPRIMDNVQDKIQNNKIQESLTTWIVFLDVKRKPYLFVLGFCSVPIL